MPIYLFAVVAMFSIFVSTEARALVSSQAQGNEGDWKVELRTTLERGKVEPNENTASFQKAKIDIYEASAARFFGAGFGSRHFAKLQLRAFESGREEAAGRLFHEKDRGQAISLTYGFDLVHELRYSLGIYASVTPFASFNKAKFSQPRIDLASLGFQLGVGLSDSFSMETLLHFGLGYARQQNSYLAFSQVVGWNLEQATGLPANIKLGPYLEMDLQERYDDKYDAAFSPTGRPDRIRAVKFGLLGAFNVGLGNDWYASLAYVQKIGGYDAPATNATSLGLGRKF